MGDRLEVWAVGAGGFLLGVAVLALKDWLGGKLKVLLEFLYGQFAGSRLLRRAALAKYTRELYRRHKEFPVSFQVDESFRLPMESVYVPLRGGNGHGNGSVDRLEAALRRKRRTVVLGVPGAGKTMLLRHETLMWAKRRIRAGRRRVDLGDLKDIPVLFELHRLNKGEGSGLEGHLSDHFKRHGFPRADKWVASALARGDLALYFDGLDEVSTDLRERVVGMIKDFAETYPECRIVVTCRVAVYEGQFAEFHQTLRVKDFDEHLIRRFLGGWPWQAGTAEATSSVDQLLGALRDTPQIMSLARNPLLLTMIAYLYDFVYAGTDQVLPHTRADFYKQVTDNLLIDRRRRSVFPYPLKKAVLRHLALVAQDVPSQAHDRLAMPAETVLGRIGAVLEQHGRDTSQAEEVLTEIVERSGLLLAVDNGERYQFAHLTLQEYLAAEFLAADPGGLLDRYRADPPAWREAVRLWCGAEARDCTEVVRAVRDHDAVLAFQCLADAHTVDDDLAESILDGFRRRLAHAGDTEIAAFGLVAGDRRTRGERVFEFLREIAATSHDSRRTRAATRALAATHLPQAVEALAELAVSPNGPAWAALGQMGDLAVPAFEEMAPVRPEAYRMLWAIRTPKAALALNRLMWEVPSRASVDRYFYLGELLTVPEIAAELRTAPTDRGTVPTWVWRPFTEGYHDARAEIAGRIGQVLRDSEEDELRRSDLPDPDPRIVAAVALLHEHGPRQELELTVRIPTGLAAAVTDLSTSSGALRQERAGEYLIDVRAFGHQMESLLDDDGSPPIDADQARSRTLDVCLAVLGQAGLPARRRALLDRLPPALRLRAAVALLTQGWYADPQTWVTAQADPGTPGYGFLRHWSTGLTLLLWLAISGLAGWRALPPTAGGQPWGPAWLGWVATAVIVAGWAAVVTFARYRGRSDRVFVVGATLFTAVAALFTVSYYAFHAVERVWGNPVATCAAAAVVTYSGAAALAASALRDRKNALTHPVRHLVLDPLLPHP
ncbi:NACHT domain-containing protein [Streptomyces sp. NPDC046915]|uniref:NACHT domain-containing protein n=1 Tax=Streptomyces sp. NPDC046915 TaxID=3155257 RepID=UPI0033E776F6